MATIPKLTNRFWRMIDRVTAQPHRKWELPDVVSHKRDISRFQGDIRSAAPIAMPTLELAMAGHHSRRHPPWPPWR
jgi:hypothetical protein